MCKLLLAFVRKWQQNSVLLCNNIHRFVVGAVVVHFFNITAIYIGTHEAHEKKTPQPMVEEKSNGAIMLYWVEMNTLYVTPMNLEKPRNQRSHSWVN